MHQPMLYNLMRLFFRGSIVLVHMKAWIDFSRCISYVVRCETRESGEVLVTVWRGRVSRGMGEVEGRREQQENCEFSWR